MNNYELTKKLETTTTAPWRCGKWRSFKCKLTATTCFGEVLTIKKDHCQEIVPGKQKQKFDGVERIPVFNDNYFELPEKFQEFCLYDSSSSDSEGMFFFREDVLLTALSNFRDTWIKDGTFKVCPGRF